MQQLKEQLMAETSRRNTNFIAGWIGNDKIRFNALWEIMISEKHPLPARAAWVFSTVVNTYPLMLNRYLENIVLLIQEPNHPGVKRNLLKVLAEIKLPIKNLGLLIDYCFEQLTKTDATVAIKIFSMEIIYQASLIEKGLEIELKNILEEDIVKNSKGYASRAKRIISEINKQNKN